jgi:hypothetical protein
LRQKKEAQPGYKRLYHVLTELLFLKRDNSADGVGYQDKKIKKRVADGISPK